MKSLVALILAVAFLTFTGNVLAEDQKKEVSVDEAMKAFCGTWIMVSGAPCQKQVWNQNETYEWYCHGMKEDPARRGTFKIEKAWEDLGGNIWCIIWRSFMGNSWTLTRISEDGNVIEHVRRFMRDQLPNEIDSNDEQYFKLIRKKNE